MMSYLNYDNPTAKGNNPYQQNRMTIDPRFRMTEGAVDVSKVQGYSATGDVLLKGQPGIAHAQNTQAEQAAQTWANMRKPQQELGSYNQVMDNISQIKALSTQTQTPIPTPAPAFQLPNWRQAVMSGQLTNHNQPGLRQLNDQRYQQIMNERY